MAEVTGNNRKRKIRNIITPIDGVVVDESDYGVVDGIFQDCLRETLRYIGTSAKDNENETKIMDIRTMFEVRKDDNSGRVNQLTILEGSRQSLPTSLLRLDALEDLKIVPTHFPIPKWLGDLKALRKLTIFLDEEQAVPPEVFSYLPDLKILDIVGETRVSFPGKKIMNLNTNLKKLVISVEQVPHEISYFTNLEILHFGSSCISIPNSICCLRNLQTLVFEECHDLFDLPEELGELNLAVLRIRCCSGLSSLPRSIGNITSLRILDLEDSSGLADLPEEFGNLTRLEYLNLKGCLGLSVGESLVPIEKLHNLRVLNLSELDVVLPENIGCLAKLECLDLSRAKVSSFPTSFRNLKNLKAVNVDGCTNDNDENIQDLIRTCFSGSDIPSVCNSLEYLHIYSADREETNESSMANNTPAEPNTKNLSFSFQVNMSTKGNSKQRRTM